MASGFGPALGSLAAALAPGSSVEVVNAAMAAVKAWAAGGDAGALAATLAAASVEVELAELR